MLSRGAATLTFFGSHTLRSPYTTKCSIKALSREGGPCNAQLAKCPMHTSTTATGRFALRLDIARDINNVLQCNLLMNSRCGSHALIATAIPARLIE